MRLYQTLSVMGCDAIINSYKQPIAVASAYVHGVRTCMRAQHFPRTHACTPPCQPPLSLALAKHPCLCLALLLSLFLAVRPLLSELYLPSLKTVSPFYENCISLSLRAVSPFLLLGNHGDSPSSSAPIIIPKMILIETFARALPATLDPQ
jgi:hypothetical protein